MKRLVDVADVVPGHPFRGKVPEEPGSPIRVVQMKDVDPAIGVSWEKTLPTRVVTKREPDWLRPGDILFLLRGGNNFATHLTHVPGQIICAPAFMVLRLKQDSGLLPEFLAWQINQAPAQRYLRSVSVGTVQRSISRAELERLPLSVPDMARQKSIVSLCEAVRREADLYQALIKSRERMLNAIAKDVLEGNR